MTQHTQGPWEVRELEQGVRVEFNTGGTVGCGDIMATIANIGSLFEMEYAANNPLKSRQEQKAQAMANARLIASAPDMLANANENLNRFEQIIDALKWLSDNHKNMPGGNTIEQWIINCSMNAARGYGNTDALVKQAQGE